MVTSIPVYDRRRVIISGQVRGVAFGLWIRSVAKSLELAGEVGELEDGRCEAVVQGERSLVKQFVVACKRGPRAGIVDHIEVIEEKLDPECRGFHGGR